MVTSVVICTQTQYKYIDCILSVAAAESDNVVVVYDAVVPPQYVYYAPHTNATFVAARKPFYGFGAGWCRDAGIAYARKHLNQDRFVFIDGDCIPSGGSIAALSTDAADVVIGNRFDVSADGRHVSQCVCSTPGLVAVSDDLCTSHRLLLSCVFSISDAALTNIQDLHRTWFGEARAFPSLFDGTWGGEDSALASAAYLLGRTFMQLHHETCSVQHQYHDRTHTYTVAGLDNAVRYHGVLKSRLGK